MSVCVPLNFSLALGELVIAGVSMHGPAWDCPDLTPLWESPDQRGSDRLIPGVVGVRRYRRRNTVTKTVLPFVITGAVNSAGVLYANPIAGLELNIAYLRANVFDPTNLTDGTRAAVLTMPSGAVRNAAVHMLGLQLGQRVKWNQRATFTLSIGAGGFV